MISVDNVKIEPTIFPDGTSQVWHLPQKVLDGKLIVWDFENEAEIMHVMQLTQLMKKPRLHCPFLPYGRQDKEVSNESTFALSSFLKIVNVMNINCFSTIDAHSNEIRKTLIADIDYVNILPADKIIEAFNLSDAEIVIYPDKGAMERYKFLNFDCVYADKVRNQSTGAIEGIVVNGIEAIRGKRAIVLDDIIDGGRTFIELAKSIRSIVSNLDIYASHCILSKGVDVIHNAGYSKIFDKSGLKSSK